MKKYIQLSILLLSYLPLFGQQKNVEDAYASYYKLPREAIHIHLNKTTFFKGEEIWFKGYAYDQKNQLSSKATTNINVGVYDANGKQVKKALFAAENGVTHGNFAIDSTFSAGTYYVKAETNWMKNFKENNAFIQKIEVITDEELNKKKEQQKARFDFQFLPEGGHIVANTKNNIGFKVIDSNGKGVSVSGIVYDESQNQVASFKSNALGMGKFLFLPKKDTQYTAEITLENGAKISKKLPKTHAQGISVIVQSLKDDHVILDFQTNAETLEDHPTKTFKVLIHQQGRMKILSLAFDALNKAIRVEKKDLFKGVNTITVFDNAQQPILERLFFNEFGIKQTNTHMSKLNTINDSILLSVKELKLNEKANISISILPETTEGYRPDHTIISNFYLKSHVKGLVENPQYYFHNMDRKKKYELDVLLLTQGWSAFNWDDIFERKPSVRHPFERGITISGRVNKPTSGIKQLFLHSTKNNAAQFIELDKDQKFEITGLFLEKDEEVRFSYINNKQEFKKPSMYLRFKVTEKEDQIADNFLKETARLATTSDITIPKDFFTKKTEALDTVVLEAENPKFTYLDKFMLYPEITNVTEETYYFFYNVVQFLNFNGFTASESGGTVSISHRASKRPSPAVFLDNFLIRDPEKRVLYNFSLANVERIEVDRYSRVPVLGGYSSGIIKIYTRKESMFALKPKDYIFLSTKTTKSFVKGKKYYAPNYASYLHPVFQKYGTIAWMPNVELNTETPTSFKIYDTFTKNITLFIEGITENGHLISERKTIQVR
ncbi:MAG: T9SS type A sorting domain-containing protein [Bacteroidota bacterium]